MNSFWVNCVCVVQGVGNLTLSIDVLPLQIKTEKEEKISCGKDSTGERQGVKLSYMYSLSIFAHKEGPEDEKSLQFELGCVSASTPNC